jgi:hypothetical protein
LPELLLLPLLAVSLCCGTACTGTEHDDVTCKLPAAAEFAVVAQVAQCGA